MNLSSPMRWVQRAPGDARFMPVTARPAGVPVASSPWWERLLPWVPPGGAAQRPPASFYG